MKWLAPLAVLAVGKFRILFEARRAESVPAVATAPEPSRAARGDFEAVCDYLKPEVRRTARREFNADQDPRWGGGK